jgi:hypothetical protein
MNSSLKMLLVAALLLVQVIYAAAQRTELLRQGTLSSLRFG